MQYVSVGDFEVSLQDELAPSPCPGSCPVPFWPEAIDMLPSDINFNILKVDLFFPNPRSKADIATATEVVHTEEASQVELLSWPKPGIHIKICTFEYIKI